MKINEIELINNQHFSKEALETWLKKSSPKGKLENFTVNYIEAGDQRGIILTDIDGNIAAYVGFVSRLNGSVWQAKNAMTYLPYQSQALVGKIYKMIKQDYKISLQSDMQQTSDGAKLWTKTLPSLGLKPMIFDTQTERILDPKTSGINMYPVAGPLENKWRYIWVLEASDHYPAQNLLPEGSLLMPYKGLWYNSN